VERLLRDPELRERLGRAGRAFARERFGWDGVIDRTLEVYRAALEA
jgi:glycosyltransferase involved in cell wall biosynthesis